MSPFADVFITDELMRRAPKKPDYLQEKLALQELAARMVVAPEDVLPHFVDLAMHMTEGVAAGLSLIEDDEKGVFRWRYLRGALASLEGSPTPRGSSPCGVTLEENRPVLAAHPERAYSWIAEIGIAVPEVLLVPVYISGTKPLGTLWIVSDKRGHFDSGHARALTELATFVGAALNLYESQKRLRRALEEQERLAAEMDHRIKNLFAIAESMIRTTARSTTSKEEMASALSGRLHALASAHSLVRRKVRSNEEGLRTTALGDVIDTIMRPHIADITGRIELEGPPVDCGDKSVDGIALAIHELATNASKYGALLTDEGRVEIRWERLDDELLITWRESGGPAIDETPKATGYGSRLISATITRQFGGALSYDWRREGLVVTMRLPFGNLRL